MWCMSWFRMSHLHARPDVVLGTQGSWHPQIIGKPGGMLHTQGLLLSGEEKILVFLLKRLGMDFVNNLLTFLLCVEADLTQMPDSLPRPLPILWGEMSRALHGLLASVNSPRPHYILGLSAVRARPPGHMSFIKTFLCSCMVSFIVHLPGIELRN